MPSWYATHEPGHRGPATPPPGHATPPPDDTVHSDPRSVPAGPPGRPESPREPVRRRPSGPSPQWTRGEECDRRPRPGRPCARRRRSHRRRSPSGRARRAAHPHATSRVVMAPIDSAPPEIFRGRRPEPDRIPGGGPGGPDGHGGRRGSGPGGPDRHGDQRGSGPGENRSRPTAPPAHPAGDGVIPGRRAPAATTGGCGESDRATRSRTRAG